MKVYLDTNVIISIEETRISIDQLKQLVDSQNVEFPFSTAHVFETDNITAETEEQRHQYVTRRLDTLKTVSKSLYLHEENQSNSILWLKEDPASVLNTITEVPFAKPAMLEMANLISEDVKDDIRSELGIEPIKLNSYTSEEVLSHLNTTMSKYGSSLSLQELVITAIHLHPDGATFGLSSYIAAFNELLDMLGYWKDKPNEKSNYARQWDSSHIHFASYCDYFISNDMRLRKRAEVIYNIFGIITTVISTKLN